MSHRELVQTEFSQQAEPMAKAPAFSDEAITHRFKEAIASKASGVMLDLACGPGMLLASLASTMRLSVGVDVDSEDDSGGACNVSRRQSSSYSIRRVAC